MNAGDVFFRILTGEGCLPLPAPRQLLFRTAHPWGLLCIRLPCRDFALRQRASASDGDFVCTV